MVTFDRTFLYVAILLNLFSSVLKGQLPHLYGFMSEIEIIREVYHSIIHLNFHLKAGSKWSFAIFSLGPSVTRQGSKGNINIFLLLQI